MTDRKLLELAAKAAGYKVQELDAYTLIFENGVEWNPLEDDGDRYRLAKQLKFAVDFELCTVSCAISGESYIFQWGGAITEARAFVLAAAEIGRAKK